MRTDGVFLAATGVFLPPRMPVAQAVAGGLFDAAEAERGGWQSVAVAGELSAPELAVRAARQALERSGHRGEELALLLHASVLHQGPDAWPAHGYVQRQVAGGSAPSLEIRQGCCGILTGLELAACYLASAGQVAALITGADNFGTPLVDRWRYTAGAGTDRPSVLGDAGTAVVLSRAGGFARLLAVNSSSVPHLEELYRSGVPLFPPEPTLGRPARLGERFAHLRRSDPTGFVALLRDLAAARTQLAAHTLAEAGIRPQDVARATHVFSGTAGYLRAVLQPLGIDPARGLLDFGRGVGHLGTGDHLAGLDHLLTTGQLSPGERVLMLGNGGTSIACAVVEIERLPSWAQAAASAG
ncbi:3-oxoacyl-[acyl-carrier-protein] synthase-3 [Kitasatospora sp. MAP12-15]|uniref:ketoacyl-ACP synthase III family protein n=1 Tax=unclassified Kitasatospora TaxID=2633591 RepID=UPI00247313F2|nr:ketoacyl-ACP synthase III family protein [Kitasatospora sp. MAP12-44]MDH6108797.1 3-oxoacyl-[acyl-carrier-protein] synthase-3 [Kitasatospora sp. MAP12-44]